MGDNMKAGAHFRDGGDYPEMVVIPPGKFMMGASEDEGIREGVPPKRSEAERPVHPVTIGKAFAVAKMPVTIEQFAVFVKETNRPDPPWTWCNVEEPDAESVSGHKFTRKQMPENNWHNPGYPQGYNHPVGCISWADAHDYAAWLAKKTGKPYRLLTEAEWEYAARAGTTTARFWGDDRDKGWEYAKVPDICLAEHFGWSKHPSRVFQGRTGWPCTAPVGSFKPNQFGLHDMLGNVFEYVEDMYHDNYEGAPSDGSAWLDGDPKRRVSRGGHWIAQPALIRSATRAGPNRDENYGMMGIRVGMSIG